MLVLAGGCARSPEAKKARYLDHGDHYYRKEQYREAILEYRNALRIDPANARAIEQLGLAHYQLGELGQSLRFLLKARELAPDHAEVRLKLGTCISSAAGRRRRARKPRPSFSGTRRTSRR